MQEVIPLTLGVTFDRQEHRSVTIGKGTKEGQLVVA